MASVYLRLGASVLALAAGAAGVVIAVLLLRSVPGPAPTSTTPSSGSTQPSAPASIEGGRIPTPTAAGYPSPPPGAVVLSREAGYDALGVALLPQQGKTLVRASVIDGEGSPAKGLDVGFSFDGGAVHHAPACGNGCYQVAVAGVSSARQLAVSIGTRRYGFALPAHTTDGTAIVANATKVWHGLKTLVWHEHLASSPTQALNTVYKAVAPHSLEYLIQTGSAAVIVGTHRWDRAKGGPWIRSTQDPALDQPSPYWRLALDARVIGSATVSGRPVYVVSFFDPASPAWFTAEIDKQNGRTLVLDMIAAAHFMHHVYGPFDAPLKIVPPTA
jgi:hypothetical protein